MTVTRYLVKFRDARSRRAVGHACGVVRIGKKKRPDARLKGVFETIEIEAGAARVTEVVERHRHDLCPETGELAIRKVVRADDGDAVAGRDGRADREAMRPACPV